MTLPAPLTPPDCDLRDCWYMLFNITELLRSRFNNTLNSSAWRAGILLQFSAFHSLPAASLPDDDKELAKAAGLEANLRKWRRLKPAAMEGWILCADGRWYHPHVAKSSMIAWRSKIRHASRVIKRLEMETGLWAALRGEVFERDDYTCQYCGDRGVRLECDHIIPRAAGGPSTLKNLATACKPCNRAKGSKPLSEWRH